MSWQQLKAIIYEDRAERRRARNLPPVACPNDGDVLDVHPNGTRNCPMGDYTWRGGPNPNET